jgi:hypothetical protein
MNKNNTPKTMTPRTIFSHIDNVSNRPPKLP